MKVYIRMAIKDYRQQISDHFYIIYTEYRYTSLDSVLVNCFLFIIFIENHTIGDSKTSKISTFMLNF